MHTSNMEISPNLASRNRSSHLVDVLFTRLDWTSSMPRVAATRLTCCMKPSSKSSLLAEAGPGPCRDSEALAKQLLTSPSQAHGTVPQNASDPLIFLLLRPRSREIQRPRGVFRSGRSWRKYLGPRGRFGSLSGKSRRCRVDSSVGLE